MMVAQGAMNETLDEVEAGVEEDKDNRLY